MVEEWILVNAQKVNVEGVKFHQPLFGVLLNDSAASLITRALSLLGLTKRYLETRISICLITLSSNPMKSAIV